MALSDLVSVCSVHEKENECQKHFKQFLLDIDIKHDLKGNLQSRFMLSFCCVQGCPITLDVFHLPGKKNCFT